MAFARAPVALLLPLCAFLAACRHALAEDVVDQFKSTEDLVSAGLYTKVLEPTLNPGHLEDLPGFTRSAVYRDHAIITPESQVYGPLPGWSNTQAAYFITPSLGAHFSLFIARMAGNATSAVQSPGCERFIFLVSGKATFKHGKKVHTLEVDSFAYAPTEQDHKISTGADEAAVLVVIEKIYSDSAEAKRPPKFRVGSTNEQSLVPVPGEMFDLRKLLPASVEYDFNIHVMDFEPGEYLNIKEVHYNQHGLLLLEGRGIYRLADKWYPVQAGDVIYMGPFVPQWYAALGKTRSRYLLYKDTNRDPLVAL